MSIIIHSFQLRVRRLIIGATPATATRSVTEHVFRTGINYHFNSPVVAKY